MRLAEFFSIMEGMMAERTRAAEVATRFYGPEPGRARRLLAIYESMPRLRRAETLAFVFPRTRAWFARGRHAHAWVELGTSYYAQAPWRAVKPLPNCAGFPAFLAGVAGTRGFEPWLAELADAEWWLHQVRGAVDDPRDGEGGPLRLSSTVEVRPYRVDLTEWIEEAEVVKPEPPPAREILALFWRNAKLVACLRTIGGNHVRVLGAVRKGIALTPAFASALGVGADELAATVRRFRAIGILAGDVDGALRELVGA
jgi:hypothetical protein